MRNLLTVTGTPQTGTNHIGPFPNLVSAFAYTWTPYVRILGNSSGYGGIQAAYISAENDDVIQSQQFALFEDLMFDRDISVSLKGGYDAIYYSNVPYFTWVQGSVTISAGTVELESIIIW